MEGAGEFLRQDGEIALNEAVRDVRRGDGFPGPEIPSRLFARKHQPLPVGLLNCRKNSHAIDLPKVGSDLL
jgi:hypothetical protein